MKKEIVLRMKPYIQPFERELALQEVRVLAGAPPVSLNGKRDGPSYLVHTDVTRDVFVERLAYWEIAEDSVGPKLTNQSLRESTVNLVRNGIPIKDLRSRLPFSMDVPLPNRRCLRYGTHGVHEYRGKFFPQLVRSLINISGAPPGGVVADPMTGSGTTVVEAVLAGFTGKGLDMNPLSVMIGQVKTQLLSADALKLANSYQKVRDELVTLESRKRSLDYFETLTVEDKTYLTGWFSEDVLLGLDEISQSIAKMKNAHAVALARVALSNIIRNVSWQKNDDLRVRKEMRLDLEIDPKKEFLEELGRSVRAVLAFLYQSGPISAPSYEIFEGDARRCSDTWGKSSVDVIITSPPYATALPYLDTDRLSLCYLGLLPRPEHRSRDQEMIGNREVTEGQRKACWNRYEANKGDLPKSVTDLIDHIKSLNSKATVGFRRRNLPSLLSKYFFDMKEVIREMHIALKPGCMAFIVVGNNHTIAGGHRIVIQTASLLQEIGKDIGFEVARSLPMEMLVSRDIFKKNAATSEEILVFRKK